MRDSISRRCAELPIADARGGIVPLGDVADVEVAPTPNEITREGGSRRIDVTCNVRGATSARSPQDIEQRARAA